MGLENCTKKVSFYFNAKHFIIYRIHLEDYISNRDQYCKM